jgi:type IV pilus assembly protein PilM
VIAAEQLNGRQENEMATSVIGIDIGNSSVRAVEVGDATKARPMLMRYFEVPLPQGAVSRGEVLEPNTVATTLKQLWGQARFSSKNVVLGMGNPRVLARDFSVPKMSLERIRESLGFQVQDMLPVPVADAILDFYPVSEGVGEHGPVVHGLLIAAVKEAVQRNVTSTSLAGLNTVDVDLIPFALSRLLVSRPRVAGVVGLIDIGANTTSVVILRNGVPQFMRIIPAGGRDLTEALKNELEIPSEDAEILKRRVGLVGSAGSPEDRRALEVIYRIASELLGSLRNTVNYYVNTRPEEPVAQLVLAGGGSHLPGIIEALSEMTRLPVSIGDPFTTISVSRKLSAQDLRTRQSSLAVALGLALGSAA